MTNLIGVRAAAAILDVDRTTVWRLVKTGALASADVEGFRGHIFERAEVEALRDRRRELAERARALRHHGVKGLEQHHTDEEARAAS